jgi:thymidylate synthase
MSYVMKPYDDALVHILESGVPRTNKRTGIKTLAVLGIQSRYRIDQHLPVVTRRKVWPKSIFAELLWFISGSTNNKDLQALGANIWTPWVSKEFEDKHGYAEGSFGPIYGFQLRHFGGRYGNGIGGMEKTQDNTVKCKEEYNSGGAVWDEVVDYGSCYGKGGFDQLAYMMQRIKEDPSCRRILFDLWNPAELHKMRLPPCHYTFQIFIDDEGKMSGELTQRSCDFPIGVPANIQFYSTLIYMIAQQTGYQPYEFVHNTVDSHIYWDQIDAVKKYLETPVIDSPKLKLNKAADIYSYKMEDFQLLDFASGPKIEIPVAV